MEKRILGTLDTIEKEYGIHILYSCESGSRGWQFPSPDSDYDVRFIYIRPLAGYLSVKETDDFITLPINDELDVYGWDLRKVLKLMHRSNVTGFEWMQSPIVYRKNAVFVTALEKLAGSYFDAKTNACHYLGLVRKFTGDAIGDEPVTIKGLFYVLRSLLCAKWNIEKTTIAPLTIYDLMVLLPADLQEEVHALIALKATSPEKYMVKVSTGMADYINTEIAACNKAVSRLEKQVFTPEASDAFFVQTLKCYDYSRNEKQRTAVAGMC